MTPSATATTLRLRSGQVLGSASAVTNLSGSVIARQWYYPYGAVRASSGALPARRTFTGQRADATGLLHSNARYSDAPLGRFIFPDSLLHRHPLPHACGGRPADAERDVCLRPAGERARQSRRGI